MLQWVGVVVPSADPKNSQTWNIGVQKDPMLHQCSDRILCWLRILELTSYIFQTHLEGVWLVCKWVLSSRVGSFQLGDNV